MNIIKVYLTNCVRFLDRAIYKEFTAKTLVWRHKDEAPELRITMTREDGKQCRLKVDAIILMKETLGGLPIQFFKDAEITNEEFSAVYEVICKLHKHGESLDALTS